MLCNGWSNMSLTRRKHFPHATRSRVLHTVNCVPPNPGPDDLFESPKRRLQPRGQEQSSLVNSRPSTALKIGSRPSTALKIGSRPSTTVSNTSARRLVLQSANSAVPRSVFSMSCTFYQRFMAV